MGLTRRDAWTLGVLLGACLLLFGWRSWERSPRPFEAVPSPPGRPAARIDLNRASAPEIEALPGVGPKTAAAILSRRPFRDLDDLARVPGLGPRGLERLAPWVAFGAPAP